MTFTPVIESRVDTPKLDLPIGDTKYLKITGAIYSSGDSSGREGGAMRMVKCTDLETGVKCKIIVSSVLEDVLVNDVDEYVGKCFAITKQPSPNNKDWYPYEVSTIKDPADA